MTAPTCHLCGATDDLVMVTAWDRVERWVCLLCRTRAFAAWRHLPAYLNSRTRRPEEAA